MSVIFVTAFVYNPEWMHRSVADRFARFRDIARTGILLCVYVATNYVDQFTEATADLPNVFIISIKEESMIPIQLYRKYDDITLPDNRNREKDTAEHLCFINSVVYFLKSTIDLNPWKTTHFAWIDFDIYELFNNIQKSQEKLRLLSQRTLAPRFLSIPGCEKWDKLNIENANARLLNNIYWRFCGGFLIGDKESISELHDLYETHFEHFLQTHKKIVWEVNFWAWLEATQNWCPIWKKADHNDSIINICADYCSVSLASVSNITIYNYPKIGSHEASNASYVYYKGEHHLNTRYVNYWYKDDGSIKIDHPNQYIISLNVHSILDNNLFPTFFQEIEEPPPDELFTKEECIFGLEDIRLYVLNDRIRFIATSRDHSPRNGNSMIVGNYDYKTKKMTDCIIVEPPTDTWCEKNWIPLVSTNEQNSEMESFIYKWHPMQIGRIIDGKLTIYQEYEINAPYFDRVRGSSTFVDLEDRLIGIVHFSEDFWPRHYYHILVTLEKKTFKPLKYSEVFYFNKIGVEFCIGFAIKGGRYCFWVTKTDHEPQLIEIPVSDIPLKFTFQ